MRSKIAGCENSVLNISGLEFNFHKYYTPQNQLEESFTSLCAFRHVIEKYKGVFVAYLPDGAKIFALNFTPGEDEFPFVSLTDYCTFNNGYIFLGSDTKKQAFFTPVF